jgi:hypothetical protein
MQKHQPCFEGRFIFNPEISESGSSLPSLNLFDPRDYQRGPVQAQVHDWPSGQVSQWAIHLWGLKSHLDSLRYRRVESSCRIPPCWVLRNNLAGARWMRTPFLRGEFLPKQHSVPAIFPVKLFQTIANLCRRIFYGLNHDSTPIEYLFPDQQLVGRHPAFEPVCEVRMNPSQNVIVNAAPVAKFWEGHPAHSLA